VTVLEVCDLTVVTAADGAPIIDDVSLTLDEGKTLGIVGESGAGKTTIALALLGMVRPGLLVRSGTVTVAGEQMLGRSERQIRKIRGRVVSYLGQDPASSLTPTMRIGRQVLETTRLGPTDTPDAVRHWMDWFELPSDQEFQRRYPHQISGGQQQRVALARAFASRPEVIVLDEPTTGLDVVTQDLVLSEIERQRRELGVSVVIVSHDLAVVARLADEILVMRDGVTAEQGELVSVLAAPSHPYSRTLVEAAPDHRVLAARHRVRSTSPPALRVEHLDAGHPSPHGQVVAADDVSFRVEPGQCVALVGSSGSGKTTIARSIVGLHIPDGGAVYVDDQLQAPSVRDRPPVERRRLQLVPQDPYGSLNPRHRVRSAIARPLRLSRGLSTGEAAEEARVLLDQVRLAPPLLDRLPQHLSGGERQRVAIAKALAVGPNVLVCDEITSALDTSVQATILDLIDELRRTLGLGVVFVSHDLGVVGRVADRVLVLDSGKVCEEGTVEQVLTSPRHDVTRRLLTASPSLSAALGR
jgi:peptide/nickel transport system ATP-binding protein